MLIPRRIIFEEDALDYAMGKELLKRFEKEKAEIGFSKNGRITGIPGKTSTEMYMEGKSTLVVGVRKALKFETCKPSAHYAIPLVSGCMGMCEYCYLNTQMGKRPYIKIHVNIDEILKKAGEYADERKPDITIFEGSATSDPIPVEPYSGALRSAIEYFGKNDHTLFRFVTKYTDVDSLLNLEHNGRTTIRFSVNTDKIITKFEHRTPAFLDRVNAACKISESGYKLGFIIAPVFLYEDWEKDYMDLVTTLGKALSGRNIKFEVISHRFTKRAKENILSIYPKSLLPMEEEIRKFKFGQFGYGKYVYKNEELSAMKVFFETNLKKYFGDECINYII